jgi:hypothetical protein
LLWSRSDRSRIHNSVQHDNEKPKKFPPKFREWKRRNMKIKEYSPGLIWQISDTME